MCFINIVGISAFWCCLTEGVAYDFVAEVVAGSAAWLGRGLSCVCAQRRDSDARPSFDLTPTQVIDFRLKQQLTRSFVYIID